MGKIINIIILLQFCSIAYSQTEEMESALGQALELIGHENEGANIEADAFYDQLITYYYHPLKINTCSEMDLNNFPLFNPIQVQQIILHREKYGHFENWQDFRVASFDFKTIETLRAFVSLEKHQIVDTKTLRQAINNAIIESSSYGKFEFAKRRGYSSRTDTRYIGSPLKWANRTKIYYPNKFSLGIISEKDAGERFLNNGKAEYISGHIAYENDESLLRSIVIGDYQISAGQGLILGQSFALGKTTNLNTSFRSGKTLRANSSANEALFYRGTALQLKKSSFELTMAYSDRKIDARVTDGAISSYPISGLHRTESELEVKKQAKLRSHVIRIKKEFKQLQLGVNYLVYARTLPSELNFNAPKQGYYGLDGRLDFNRGIFFSELAINQSSKKQNFIVGTLLNLHQKLNASFVYRHFRDTEMSILSNPFKSGSANSVERGLYSNLEFLAHKNWTINFMLDQYAQIGNKEFQSPKHLNHDIIWQVAFNKKRKLNSYIRLRTRLKQESEISNQEIIRESIANETMGLRLHFNYNINGDLSLKSRLEYSSHKQEASIGKMFYQEIKFHPIGKRYALSFRQSWFNIPSYSNRIYSYESQVPYIFSIPAYYGIGNRSHLKLSFKPTNYISIWLRYAAWNYKDRKVISSGLQEIVGSQLDDLSFNLKLSF